MWFSDIDGYIYFKETQLIKQLLDIQNSNSLLPSYFSQAEGLLPDWEFLRVIMSGMIITSRSKMASGPDIVGYTEKRRLLLAME